MFSILSLAPRYSSPANWPLFTLTCLITLFILRRVWRSLRLRLAFAGSGPHAGRVALVWFLPSLRGPGGRWRRLWLPAWASRRLWLARACGSGRLARWLRRIGQ